MFNLLTSIIKQFASDAPWWIVPLTFLIVLLARKQTTKFKNKKIFNEEKLDIFVRRFRLLKDGDFLPLQQLLQSAYGVAPPKIHLDILLNSSDPLKAIYAYKRAKQKIDVTRVSSAKFLTIPNAMSWSKTKATVSIFLFSFIGSLCILGFLVFLFAMGFALVEKPVSVSNVITYLLICVLMIEIAFFAWLFSDSVDVAQGLSTLEKLDLLTSVVTDIKPLPIQEKTESKATQHG